MELLNKWVNRSDTYLTYLFYVLEVTFITQNIHSKLDSIDQQDIET